MAGRKGQILQAHTIPAPLLGQHNHELLSELGLTEAEIAVLTADGVIATAPAAG